MINSRLLGNDKVIGKTKNFLQIIIEINLFLDVISKNSDFQNCKYRRVQMKRTTIFIIFILMLSILLFTSCGKKEVERELPEREEIEEPTATEETDITPEKEIEKVSKVSKEEIQPEIVLKGEKVFELQLVAVRDYARIEAEQNKLARYGYNTFITTTVKGGKTFYRLRLDDLYTYSEAFALGEKLKEQFFSIHEYWIQKVK